GFRATTTLTDGRATRERFCWPPSHFARNLAAINSCRFTFTQRHSSTHLTCPDRHCVNIFSAANCDKPFTYYARHVRRCTVRHSFSLFVRRLACSIWHCFSSR